MTNSIVLDPLLAKVQGFLAEADAWRAIRHQPTQGRLVEILLTNLIRPMLPPTIAAVTGHVIDCEGGQSGQEDIILYNPEVLPGFFTIGEQRVVPIEAALAIIEVKTTLESGDIEGCLGHISTVRSLANRLHGVTNQLLWLPHPVSADELRWPLVAVFALSSKGAKKQGEAARYNKVLAKKKCENGVQMLCVARKCLARARAPLGRPSTELFEETLPVNAQPGYETLRFLASILDHIQAIRLMRSALMASSSYADYLTIPLSMEERRFAEALLAAQEQRGRVHGAADATEVDLGT